MSYLRYSLDKVNQCFAVYRITSIPNDTKIIRGYVRCSTKMQVDEGFTIESQCDAIINFCIKHNYYLIGMYYDRGISGKYDGDVRFAFGQLMKDIQPGESCCAISQDRLYRDTEKASAIANRLREKKCGLMIIQMNNGIDINGDNNTNFLFKLMSTIAEKERDQISERVTLNMKYLKNNGMYKPKPHFGFVSPGRKKPLVSNPQEMEVVEYIRSLRVDNINIIVSRIIDKVSELYSPENFGIKMWDHKKINRIIKYHNIPDKRDKIPT